MSIFKEFRRSKGVLIYIIALVLIAVSAFFIGYFIAKSDIAPIIIEKHSEIGE